MFTKLRNSVLIGIKSLSGHIVRFINILQKMPKNFKPLERLLRRKKKQKLSYLESVALALLQGVYDDGCVLHKLRGTPHIVKAIHALATNDYRWKRCIKYANRDHVEELESSSKNRLSDYDEVFDDNGDDDVLFFTQLRNSGRFDETFDEDPDEIHFPSPSDINVNMMPFVLKRPFEASGLPEFLRPYWPMIDFCTRAEYSKSRKKSQRGRVCYLTVQEGPVEAGTSQRRPGLHVDCPGCVKIAGSKREEDAEEGSGGNDAAMGGGSVRKKDCVGSDFFDDCDEGAGSSSFYHGHPWGMGECHFVPRNHDDENFYNSHCDFDENVSLVLDGGIYMASSVEDSCEAFNCQIVSDPKTGDEIIGRHGNIEHVRHLLPSGRKLSANRMYWMTDRTPHESLPLEKSTYRQFFRLVMSQVGLWYKDHSTPNPNGIVPHPKVTKIVAGSKFEDNQLWIVDS